MPYDWSIPSLGPEAGFNYSELAARGQPIWSDWSEGGLPGLQLWPMGWMLAIDTTPSDKPAIEMLTRATSEVLPYVCACECL